MFAIDVRAILVDMDGTLVESTDGVERIWTQWCHENGIPPARVLDICHGVRARDIIRRVAPRLDLEQQIAILDALEIRYFSGVNALPGAADFLYRYGDRPWAVVTSASRPVVMHKLLACRLPVPPVLISASDVVNGKPDPEPYRLAAERLGIAAADCLVFEDAAAGIQSALAAGCRAMQVGDGPAYPGGIIGSIRDWRHIDVTATDGPWVRLTWSSPD